MLRRDRRSLDIAGNIQLSRIKTEQTILNLFDRDYLGNRLSVFRDNEFCLSGLHTFLFGGARKNTGSDLTLAPELPDTP
jgi:hypothetical protein